MAASYPSLLASGVSNLGRFDQFDLFAGERDIVTTAYQTADGQAISQFQVLALNAAGRVIPLTQTGDYAIGSFTVGGQPTAADTVTVNGHVITFVASAPTATDCLIGATATDTATNLAAVINSNPEFYGVTAVASGTAVNLTATSIGTAGNAITLVEGVTDAGFVRSGATLSGADAAEDIPSRNAIAIAAQPVAAVTPGAMVPVFIGGVFNHQALLWPSALTTLADRKAAFAGTPIAVEQLL